ncbi:MAG TPA: alpha/beta hydrolase fold domain-containing protein [Caulobacter sp.]|nr:alpha/beta hydrolase fold domain-containing protein [Caulobacter sp.]
MLVGLIRRRLDPWLARPDPSAPQLHSVEDLNLPGADGPLAARLYRSSAEAADLLVFLHGGGLVSSGLATHDAACRRLAEGSGFAVLAVDYRRAPEARYPAAHDDAEAALAWAATSGALRFVPRRLLAGGDSAGGLLAATVALRRARAGRPLDGLALFYPLLALDPTPDDPPLFRISRAWMRRLYVGDGPADPRDLTLLNPETAELPPTFIASGGRDPTRLDAKRLCRRLPEVAHHLEPRATHGFLNLAGVSDRAREQTERSVAALRAAFA